KLAFLRSWGRALGDEVGGWVERRRNPIETLTGRRSAMGSRPLRGRQTPPLALVANDAEPEEPAARLLPGRGSSCLVSLEFGAGEEGARSCRRPRSADRTRAPAALNSALYALPTESMRPSDGAIAFRRFTDRARCRSGDQGTLSDRLSDPPPQSVRARDSGTGSPRQSSARTRSA